ncbi:TonB-dependent receptor [Aliifodinibius salicampi]|uniref:TonB-dependent receptor n=1 Tax=Fodinibius salicampi TaxID=1920655 RepID=A0ABT3PXB9_9BACT|nr:TonB-dependent receptor [Fodinibius salicampi]
MNIQLFSQWFKTALLLAIVFYSFSLSAKAQSDDLGTITGKVVDAESGEPIIGANVSISGTTKGAASDIDGVYRISGIQPGSHSITVSYISYTKKNITDIQVESGEVTQLNVSLQPETIGLGEVTVTAQASTDSEAGLLSIQRKAVPMQDGLSSEYLGKTGDGNVASAMKRVTGVTLLNGKDVFIRGLGNRYSNVQLNGAPVPSTSPTKKEAPVDLINSGSVENIVVQKTFTPDQSGEFSGGSVQITSKEFPEEKNIGFSYSTSYNSVSTFENTIGYRGSPMDFLGFDNGKRTLPAVIKNSRVTSENEKELANALHGDWLINSNQQAIPSQKFELSYADQLNEANLPIGIVSNFSYKYDRSYQPGREYRVIQSYNSDADQNVLNADYMRREGKEDATLSGMLNVFLKPNSKTKIGLKNLYSNSLENSTQLIIGDYVNYPRNTRQTVQDFNRRAIFSSSGILERYFDSFLQSQLSVNISYSRAKQDRPDRRTTQYNLTPSDTYNIYFDDGGNTHFFSDQLDNNYTAKVDYELQPLRSLGLKAGFSGLLKDRDFNARRLEYQNFSGAYPNDRKDEPANVALDPVLIENDQLDLVETTQARDSYQGEQTLLAGYLSANMDFIENLTLEAGARVEQSIQKVKIRNDGESQAIANVDKTDILPAVNATYSASDKINFRGAFSMTLARPEFREISDFRFQDFVGSQIVYGNPDLNRTLIHNYDIRFESYPNPGEIFAISAFYKKFFNPIELFYRFTERTEVQYKNADQANLYGIEVEGRRNVTEQLQLVVNASYILSETRSKEEDRFRTANFERPMYGQSPYSFNAGTFYTIPQWNMELSANYNTFGERIVTVGMGRHPDDEYEQPFHKVDLGVKYRPGQFTIKADVENLLDQEVVYKQGDVITNKYAPGVTYNVGISYNF